MGSRRGCRHWPRSRRRRTRRPTGPARSGTVDRSERIRTYNFPENRIADHRINFKAHNLDQVLDGDMGRPLDALVAADKQARLQQA